MSDIDETNPMFKMLMAMDKYDLEMAQDHKNQSLRGIKCKHKELLEKIEKETICSRQSLETVPAFRKLNVTIKTTESELQNAIVSYETKKEKLRQEFMAQLDKKVESLLTNDRRSIDAMKSKIEKCKKNVEELSELPDKKTKALKVAEYESYKTSQELWKLQEELDYIEHCIAKKTHFKRF